MEPSVETLGYFREKHPKHKSSVSTSFVRAIGERGSISLPAEIKPYHYQTSNWFDSLSRIERIGAVQTMLRFGQAIACLAFAVVASGCTNFTPLPAGRTIRGIPSADAAVVVPTSVIGRLNDVRLDMGPGTCAPLIANDTGVFFESDQTVVVRSWIMNPETLPGGVFVPDDPTQACKPYYYRMGMPIPVKKTQNPATVVLVDKRTGKKTPLRLE